MLPSPYQNIKPKTAEELEKEKPLMLQESALPKPVEAAPEPVFEDQAPQVEPVAQTPRMPAADFGLGLARKGLMQQVEGEQQVAQAEVQAAQAEQELLNQQAKKLQDDQDRRAIERNKSIEEIEKLEKDYSDTKLTSPDIWGNASTGGKIMLALGAILSSASPEAAQAFRSGITNAIDRDIDLQKSNLAKKRQTVDSKKSLYRDMLDRYKDEDAATLAVNKIYLDKIGAELKAKAANAKSPIVQGKSNVLLAEWQKISDSNNANLLQKQMELLQKSGQLSPAMQGADEITKKIMQLPENFRKEAFKEYGLLKGVQAAEKSISASFDEFSKISAVSGKMPFSESKANADTIKPKLLAEVVKSMGGNPSDRDLAVINRFLPDLTDTVPQIEQKKKNMVGFMKGKQLALNPTPLLEGFGIKISEEQRDSSLGFK